jgi:Tol biopolymer transport system component
LFKIAVDGGAAASREGSWFNPVWSPDGKLIVYTGPRVAGQAVLLGVRPDGTPVALPEVRVRPGAYRFLPDGKGVVYLPRTQSVDFWLLDLTAHMTRQLTRLGNLGALSTFDVTPDGRHIVFERSRENSNVVVIDLP